MLNRPLNAFFTPAVQDGPLWDRRPGTRLLGLGLLLIVPLVLVGSRVIWLQGLDSTDFSRRSSQVTVTNRPIPTFDGRILAADGKVLAQDLQRFRVRIHFRWLEEPPNRDWLLGQALTRLAPRQRRDSKSLEVARGEVLRQRKAMHATLAELCGRKPRELRQQMDEIQRRVERIVSRVEQRQRTRTIESLPTTDTDTSLTWWRAAWSTVHSTLTTPPRRSEPEPIVVQEQLQYHLLIDDVPFSVAARIEEHPGHFPGLEIESESRRFYPSGSLAAHVVGTRKKVSAGTSGHQPGDWIGATGVERSYDRILQGRPGTKRIVTNRQGEIISTKVLRRAQRGDDIELTLSLPLQRGAERLLDEAIGTGLHGGAIVVLDVHSGAIRAAASAPRFDPNLLISPNTQAWQRLVEDPRRPLFCRTTGMALPPGSIFKSLAATAFLESGLLDGEHQISCRGYLDHPDRYRCYIFRHNGIGHGETNLGDALCRSCNVFFFAAARRLARAGGSQHQALHTWAARFGFGRRTGIDLPFEVPGQLPPIPTRPQVSETMQLAIGQGPVTATPIQVARLMAGIGNDGYLVTPHVVSTTGFQRTPDAGRSIKDRRRDIQRIPSLGHDTLAQVREGLRRVVADPRGTGYQRVKLPDIAIAGKTGTAEVGGDLEDHAWFAGYVPAKRPRLAFVVVLEHAGTGSRAAGPLARQLVKSIQQAGLTGRQHVTRHD